MTEFATIPLCLSQIPQPSDGGPKDASGDGDGGAPGECDKWTCQGCPVDKVGRTFCQGTDLFGCLVSTNPRCGLKCEKVLVKHCNKCVETEGVIDCEETGILPQDPCKDLPCSACPAGQVTFCQDRSVSTCLRAAFEGEACHEICLPEELAQCPQQCVQAADQAQCAP